MSSGSAQRYRSGDICLANGRYRFDGYFDGLPYPAPPLNQQHVELTTGDVFPTAGGPDRACYWRRVDGSVDRPFALHAAPEM